MPATSTPLLPDSALPSVPEDRSSNWAGYAVQPSFASPESNAVESVEATWNVPTVDCSLASNDYASAFWIGIDGVSSGSVEQIGTDSDCTGGSPVYYAWYEVYPQGGVTLDIALSPGDEVNARIDYLGTNTFRYTLRDLTTSKTVSMTDRSQVVAHRSSAEWIAEAPSNGQSLVPLADFHPVDFRNATVTLNGKSGSISGDGWEYQPILKESRGGPVKGDPFGTHGQRDGLHRHLGPPLMCLPGRGRTITMGLNDAQQLF